MNRQKPALGNRYIKTLKKGFALLFCGAALFMFSCKSDLEKVNIFASELDLPNISATNLEIEHTDTGKLQVRFVTPILNRYTTIDEPYYEFPEGVEVYFYDNEQKVSSVITANYSIYYEEKQLWEARDSVVARNMETGEKIETEQMFWEQPKQIIYSKVFTKITNEDGVYYGEDGFEAAQDLSRYKLLGSSGTVRVKDEEEEPSN